MLGITPFNTIALRRKYVPKTTLKFNDLLVGFTEPQKSCYTHDYIYTVKGYRLKSVKGRGLWEIR